MKQKMTIHRALAELKLIDSRIEKGIETINPTGIIQKGKKVNGFYEQEDFEKEAKAKLQSITDLIERKSSIKSAIVQANSKALVKINGKEMTIADAINYKNSIEFRKKLIESIKQKHQSAKALSEQKNAKIEANALSLAQAALSKDNVKIGDDDASSIIDPYLERNKFNLVDPLNAEKLIEELQKEVDDFETEVDAVLSEINAVTIIEA